MKILLRHQSPKSSPLPETMGCHSEQGSACDPAPRWLATPRPLVTPLQKGAQPSHHDTINGSCFCSVLIAYWPDEVFLVPTDPLCSCLAGLYWASVVLLLVLAQVCVCLLIEQFDCCICAPHSAAPPRATMLPHSQGDCARPDYRHMAQGSIFHLDHPRAGRLCGRWRVHIVCVCVCVCLCVCVCVSVCLCVSLLKASPLFSPSSVSIIAQSAQSSSTTHPHRISRMATGYHAWSLSVTHGQNKSHPGPTNESTRWLLKRCGGAMLTRCEIALNST